MTSHAGDGSRLTAAQLEQMVSLAVAQQVRVGDVVFRPGDAAYDLIVIESGRIQILTPATDDEAEAVLAEYGPGGFLGELNLLTGQTAYLSARVIESGTIHRLGRAQFRRLMAERADISDLLLRTFLARRDVIRQSSAAHLLEIVGHPRSAAGLTLRTYAARQRLPHLWLDADGGAGQALMRSVPLAVTDLPAVLMPDRVLRRARPQEVADALGLTYRPAEGPISDLLIIGAGPAGLGAAVTAASEGLTVTLLDRTGPGGRAAASSRIENYVGFPHGVSGSDLTQKALLQAMKFGAQVSSPCEVRELTAHPDRVVARLADGTSVHTRAVLLACGVEYERLDLPGLEEFENSGIYYAATNIEASACSGSPVTIVGGANSAGQAALHLAARASHVTLAVRAPDLRVGMSAYLVDRIRAEPRITVFTSTEVTGLAGSESLRSVELTDRTTGHARPHPCHGLFCLIGARPDLAWASPVEADEHGFVLTGDRIIASVLDPVWKALERSPFPYETSIPGVFAAGDVRAGSVKRVATAVGEGAGAVQSVLAVLGARV